MRKALLSSSEVSALASVSVVLLFTLALFFSGYVLQQRTLHSLRAAIRPDLVRPSPRAHLPDYFKREATTLPDGTIVVGLSQADRDEQARLAKKYELHDDAERVSKETHASPPDQSQQSKQPAEAGHRMDATDDQLNILASLQAHTAKQSWGVDHPDPLAKSRLPISRAERRRLIKEEIQRLAQEEKPLYYQRRLW